MSQNPSERLRIVFFQAWSILGASLAERLVDFVPPADLLVVGPDVPPLLRDRRLIAAARHRRVKLLTAGNVLEPRFLDRLREFAPDLLLVATWQNKLPNQLLELPRLAAVNLHPAYLPAYRGACPEFWVLRNGETATGVSLHHMTERFDAGRVLAQAKVPIRPDDTLVSLTERMIDPSWRLLQDLIGAYRRGERPEGTPQDTTQVSRAPMVREQHLRIRWNSSAEDIARLVRAAYPVYEARAAFRPGLDLLIHRAAVVADPEGKAVAGQLVIHPAQRRLLVGTGEGWLELLEVQVTFAPRMNGWQLCHEYGLVSGDQLPEPAPAPASAPAP